MFGAANSLVGSSTGYYVPERHEVGGSKRTASSFGLEGGIYPLDSNLGFIGNGPASGGRTELHVAFLALAALGIIIGLRSLGFRSIIAVSR